MVCELSPIRRVILDGLKGGVEEGLQETIQQIMGNPIAQELYDPERDTFTGAAKGAAVGFTVGDIFSTLGSMIAGGGQRGRRGAASRRCRPRSPGQGPLGAKCLQRAHPNPRQTQKRPQHARVRPRHRLPSQRGLFFHLSVRHHAAKCGRYPGKQTFCGLAQNQEL